MKICFIGFGNMAKAMAQGLLMNKKNQLWAAAPSLTVGINQQGIHTHHDNVAIIAEADIIILAVKPAQMAVVLGQIKTALPTNCLLVSIAAGLTLSWFAQRGSNQLALVRAMPNITAAVAKGATPLIANAFVTEQQKQQVDHLFAALGLTCWVEQEDDIDVFTALSGSGPAYLFLFMEAMKKAGVALGLSEEIAESFTLQTCHGALHLASKSELSLAELRNKVTSPAGTTAAAIDVFSARGLDEIVFAAMKAARDRAQQLQLSS